MVGHYASAGDYKVGATPTGTADLYAFYDTTLLFPLDALSLPARRRGRGRARHVEPRAPGADRTLTTLPMLSPHESLYLDANRGLLAADMGNPASYPGLMSIYDVSQDCRTRCVGRHLPRGPVRSRSVFLPTAGRSGSRAAGRGSPRRRVGPQASAHDLQDNEFSHGGSVSDDSDRFYAADSVLRRSVHARRLADSGPRAESAGPRSQPPDLAAGDEPANLGATTIDGHHYLSSSTSSRSGSTPSRRPTPSAPRGSSTSTTRRTRTWSRTSACRSTTRVPHRAIRN